MRMGASTLPQYLAAFSATLGGLQLGSVLGWMAPASADLEAQGYGKFTVSEVQSSLMGGLMPVGAMVGSAMAGPVADKIGRRTTLLAQVVPWIVAWSLIIWADSILMMYAGRILLGFVCGFFTVVVPMYVNEISQTRIQGTLGVIFQLQSSYGILYAYIVGKYVTVYWLSVCCCMVTALYVPMMLLMPESPRYHLMKRHRSRAAASLQWLRGKSYDISSEMQHMEASVDKAALEKVTMSNAFSARAAKKALFIGVGVMFFQQFCGVGAILFYTVTIFQEAGSSLPPNDCTIVVGAVGSVMTFLSVFIVDRLGRKPLLLSSAIAQAVSCLVLGVYYFLKARGNDVSSIGWLPLVCIVVYVAFFAVGLGPIPWMLIVEVFPPSVRGPASSVACLVNWFGAVTITMSFSPLKQAIGVHGSDVLFWIYGFVSAMSGVFVALVVPETKGKDIDQVTAMLDGKIPARRPSNFKNTY